MLQVSPSASLRPRCVSLMVALAAGFIASAPGLAQTAPPIQPGSGSQAPENRRSTPDGASSAVPKGGDHGSASAADPTGKADQHPANAASDPRAGNHAAFFAARLAALHAGLTLNTEQEGLWTPVEAAIRALDKTHNLRQTREGIASLLSQSPSDLLRMRGEQLSRRGDAMRQLAEAAAPFVEKLDDAQKSRLPVLLEGMRPGRVLKAAFDIRWGEVVDGADDDPASRSDARGGGRASSDDADAADRGDGSGATRNEMQVRGNRYRQQGMEDRRQERAHQSRDRFDVGDDDQM